MKITANIVVSILMVLFLLSGCTPSKTEEEAYILLNNRGYTNTYKLDGRTLSQACIDFKVKEENVHYILKGTCGGYPDLNVCYIFCLCSAGKAKKLKNQLDKLSFYTEIYGNVVLADTNSNDTLEDNVISNNT